MSDIHINAEAYAGTDIDSACKKLCKMATRIDCNVHCSFNGVTLIVRPNDDASALAEAWDKELRSGHSIKVTSSNAARAKVKL